MTRYITVRSGLVPRKVVPPASAASAAGADTDAIHDNVSAEISVITSKATPVGADFLLIEDSAAGDAKKKITIGDLPFISDGVALGGGATPTLGTIGGSGPTSAAQAQWIEVDIGGTPHWIPVWT